MIGIKGLADFQDRFFNSVKEKSAELIKGNLDEELRSGKDFPVSIRADFCLLINEINALKGAESLLAGVTKELQNDFKELINSTSFDNFVDNFRELVTVEQFKKAPDVLRGIIHMEIGLVLSFVTVLKNFERLQMEDYAESLNQYFFARDGYKTVSGDLIMRPQFPNVRNLEDARGIGDQINAERYIRDITRIVGETTGDALYDLRPRYVRLVQQYQSDSIKKLIGWFNSFGDLAEASLLPAVEGIINGAFNLSLNPLIAAAIGTFCSVTARKATEHSYLALLRIMP
ncbi:MAG: hypothetical protein PHT49_05205 [Desulfovibrionales bacterium]|nr:hypothetical protein [Desulfovibrionales bacterium]